MRYLSVVRCDSEGSVIGWSVYFCTLLNIQAILDVRLNELMVSLETISDMMEFLLHIFVLAYVCKN